MEIIIDNKKVIINPIPINNHVYSENIKVNKLCVVSMITKNTIEFIEKSKDTMYPIYEIINIQENEN